MKPKQQSTFAYSFVPADAFAGRPIGLTVNLAYRDGEGNFFIDPVFNETVQVMMIVVMIVIIVRMVMTKIKVVMIEMMIMTIIKRVTMITVILLIQIVEFDEGFDTETFFMYVCMAGAVVLLLFLGFNYLSGRSSILIYENFSRHLIIIQFDKRDCCPKLFVQSLVFRQED